MGIILQPFFDQLIIGTILKLSHVFGVSMTKPFVDGKPDQSLAHNWISPSP